MTELEGEIEATVAVTTEGLIAQIDYMAESYGSGVEDAPCVCDVPLAFLETLKAGVGRL